ncbi:PAS domain-containing protein [Pseudoduganella rivuli]|uniref:PAS domain-containing protein n=1 Tax=Pseudoduganella rivuli TaxID=2666085 RepID=UPI0035316307
MTTDNGKLPTIRSQIALLVLVCALPSVVGLGVMVQHFYQRETVQVSRDALVTARAVSAAIEHDISEAESTALALAASPSLAAGDLAAFAAQARKQLRPNFPGARFILTDAAGRQVLSVAAGATAPALAAERPSSAIPAAGPPARLRPLFEQGRTVAANLPSSASDGQRWLAIDVPVEVNGKVAYALTTVLRHDRLTDLLAEQRLPPHMIASLLDGDGVILARNKDAPRFVGQSAPPDVLDALRDGDEGAMRTVSMEGIKVYAAFAKLPHHNWRIAVAMPEEHALDGMMPSVPLVTGAVTLLVLAGFAMSWLMGGQIGRSVSALTQPAHALATGEPMVLAPSNFLEAEEVATALRQVEGDIQRHRHQLELLVAERTAELAASKALLENVYASAPVGLSFVDLDLRIVMINEYLAAINDKPVSEHIGRHFGDVIRDEQVIRDVERDYRKVMATGEAISGIELTGTAPGKPDDVRHWLTGYFPVRSAEGKLIGITGLLLDITDQKRTEQELRQSKQLFKSVVEHMPVSLFVKRASDLRFEMLNHQGELTFGLPREVFIGKNDYDFFPADQADAFTAADRAVLASGDVVEIPEEPLTSADGQLHYLHTRKVALRDDDGKPTHLLGIAIDITERKRADEVLRATSASLERSNAFIRAIADNVPGMVVYWDEQMRCRFANKYFAEFMGRPVEDILGATIRDVLGERLYQENLSHIESVMAGTPQSFYQDRLRADGEMRFVWASYFPDLDDQGKVCGFFVMVSDVTELKRGELRLHDLNDQLIRARDRAEAASRAKSEFVANMSHEIRTPMNAILGLARLLEEAPLERRERSYVGKIQLATQSLLAVVNDVLDFSKIEAGQLKLDINRLNLDHILTSIGVVISQAAWDKGVEPIFAVGADVPMELVGDAMRLQQVLLNLASNAVKFTQQGEVVLGVRLVGSSPTHVSLEFSVRDTGIGIPHDQQEHMFDAFSQADTSTSRQYGGTGLGLAICRRLVDLMGSSITVQSEPGRGSVFRFTLVLERAVTGVPTPAPLPDALQGLALLVVDDNATVRDMLARHCLSLGWSVWTADSGAAALALLHKLARSVGPRQLDMLLLDARLPDMDGIGLLTQAHTDHSLQLPPTIMMAPDHLTEEMQALADTLHIASVLAKPSTPSRMMAAITAVRTGTAQPSAMPVSTPLAGRLAGVRVLLVEDNEINQEMAQYILLHAGARVEIAANGKIAVDMLEADGARCDAVLMDLQMPVMNGYEATAALRAMGLRDLPIIAMTANAMEEDRRLAIEAGVDAHVPKPIDVEEMIDTLLRFTSVRSDPAAATAGGWAVERDDRPAEVPGIDLDAALKRLAGNYPAFVGLLKRFENSQGGTVSDVRTLLAHNKREEAAKLLHRLRGVAANLGAGDIARISAQAEIALHQDSDAELAFMLTALDQSIAVVTAAARTLPLPLPAGTAVPEQRAEMDLTQALQELVSLLQTNNMKALTHFQSVRPSLESSGHGTVLALANAIETLDFAAAETLVRDLLKRKENA